MSLDFIAIQPLSFFFTLPFDWHFHLFAFKVIIAAYVLTDILLIPLPFFSFFFFFSLLFRCDLMIIFRVTFGFRAFFCVSVLDFWFVITVRFISSYICIASSSSVTQLCLTPCDPVDCSMPGIPVHHQHPQWTQTHVL